MLLKKLLLLLLVSCSPAFLLQAADLALPENDSQQQEEISLTIYQKVHQEFVDYYDRECFEDKNKTSGWYRVDNFLKWLQKNETVLANSPISWNDKKVFLKDLLADLQNTENWTLFWSYLGSRYVFDTLEEDTSKLVFSICTRTRCHKEAGKPVSVFFSTDVTNPIQIINIAMHEATHARSKFKISELAACTAQNIWGLPIKVELDKNIFYRGVRDFRISYERLGLVNWTLNEEYNECVIAPFFPEWALLIEGQSKISSFCTLLKTAFPKPACKDCTFTQREDFLLIQKILSPSLQKSQTEAQRGHLQHAGFYNLEEILSFFSQYYNIHKEEELPVDGQEIATNLKLEKLKSELKNTNKKYSLYFYTVQGTSMALISDSDFPLDVISNALPLHVYQLPIKERITKMEAFYLELLGIVAEENFKCSAIFPDVVKLLDKYARPQTRPIVPEGYI